MTYAKKLLKDTNEFVLKNVDEQTYEMNLHIDIYRKKEEEKLSKEDMSKILKLGFEYTELHIRHNISEKTYMRKRKEYLSCAKKLKDEYGIGIEASFPFSNPSELKNEINTILANSFLNENQIKIFMKNLFDDSWLACYDTKSVPFFRPSYILPYKVNQALLEEGAEILKHKGSGFGDDKRFDKFKNTVSNINAVMRHNNLDEITIRQYFGLDGGVPESIEFNPIYEEANEMMHKVESFFSIVFDISLSKIEAAQFTNSDTCRRYQVYSDEYVDEITTTIQDYKRTENTIKLCFDVSPAKINATISTLKALKLDVPMELEIAEDIRCDKNVAENKKKTLHEEALKDYFPFITDKKVINKIWNGSTIQ